MGDRRVELEYVFDRLGDLQLSQAYRLLVPEQQKLTSKENEDVVSAGRHLREGL